MKLSVFNRKFAHTKKTFEKFVFDFRLFFSSVKCVQQQKSCLSYCHIAESGANICNGDIKKRNDHATRSGNTIHKFFCGALTRSFRHLFYLKTSIINLFRFISVVLGFFSTQFSCSRKMLSSSPKWARHVRLQRHTHTQSPPPKKFTFYSIPSRMISILCAVCFISLARFFCWFFMLVCCHHRNHSFLIWFIFFSKFSHIFTWNSYFQIDLSP